MQLHLTLKASGKNRPFCAHHIHTTEIYVHVYVYLENILILKN